MSAKGSNVRVFVRFRPTANFAQDTIKLGEDNKTIDIHIKKDEKFGVVNNQRSDWSFKVDGFLHNASQDSVYNAAAKPVVSKVLDGYNGTIMCYGQTGAGKTFTTTGATGNYKLRGIIPRVLQQVFKEIEERSEQSVTVRVSYLEIYNETLFDLLSTLPDVPAPDTQMTIVDDAQGVSVKGLSIHHASSEEDAMNLLFEGETNRIIGSHILNKNSSRSHCIFTIHLESEGQILKEAAYINKSLTFLEQAIIALADRRRDHIPFRQSKLTYALKDSLGGNCNTVLVANVYGEAAQISETLSTLRFASRMKCIPAESVVIEHYDPVRVAKNLAKEIAHLKQELAIHDTLANRTNVSYEPFNESQIGEINTQVRRYLDGNLHEIDIINIRQIQEVCSQFKIILSQQEQEVEARLRQKYTLIDRNDYVAIAAAQKFQSVFRRCLAAGGMDPSAFGTHFFRIGAATAAAENGCMLEHIKKLGSSPPTKTAAFEEFKAERGSEINRIFKENKTILTERKNKLKEITQHINTIKQEIDVTSQTLNVTKLQREKQGEYINDEGQIIIDEQEFTLIVRLKDLKKQYRADHEELQDLKGEVQYCQKLVDQCRQRLLTEFDIWYNESFIIPEDMQNLLKAVGSIRPGMIPINRLMSLGEDEQERNDKLQQELLMEIPGALPYHNARIKSDRKHNYSKAMYRTKKKPGVITSTVKNKLPSMPTAV
ncbi:hypothetical protein FKM82_007302 [Ascaphus truei]